VPGRTVRESLSFDGGGQFFFLITCHRGISANSAGCIPEAPPERGRIPR
jgi:hypothetical protein